MKIGRNNPCCCGSGKKYKKCCLNKKSVPADVIDFFKRTLTENENFRRAGIHVNYVTPIDFKGKKIWALGNKVYSGGINETFHTFIINVLKDTIGVDWFREQSILPQETRHFISICLEKLGEWIKINEKTALKVNGIWGAKPDGYSKSLLLLAFDICSLIHEHKLPKDLLDRLKSRELYQGARYEIAIAAIFARLDCDIEFTDIKSKDKHCEFFAKHRPTGVTIAVEAKSKHRPGVLHQFGFSSLEKLLSARMIRRLFNSAIEQNPKTAPFAIFIDVNAPITPNIPLNEKQWVNDARKILEKKLNVLSLNERPNSVFFTNFSYHYQTDKEAEKGEVFCNIIENPKFEPPNPEFFGYLQGALTHYGFIPAIGIDAAKFKNK